MNYKEAKDKQLREQTLYGQIKVTRSPIQGLVVIEPTIHRDERGSFIEVYNAMDMHAAGYDYKFVQENQSYSKKGVLRGLHYQKNYPQCKFAQVLLGAVYDVAVDIRSGSPTYGQWYGVELSAENHCMLLIPEGFAHGLLTLTDQAIFSYKCTDFYHPNDEGGIAWNDPEIAISWPVRGLYSGSAKAEGYTLSDGTPLLISAKDQSWGSLSKNEKVN